MGDLCFGFHGFCGSVVCPKPLLSNPGKAMQWRQGKAFGQSDWCESGSSVRLLVAPLVKCRLVSSHHVLQVHDTSMA